VLVLLDVSLMDASRNPKVISTTV